MLYYVAFTACASTAADATPPPARPAKLVRAAVNSDGNNADGHGGAGADEDDGSNGGNATPRRWRLSANSLDTKLSRRVSDDGLTLLL